MKSLQTHGNFTTFNLLLMLFLPVLFYSCSKDTKCLCEKFSNSIIIVPDIQIYTNYNNSQELSSIVNFINENKDSIAVCLQTGDLTNNNTISQWENVSSCYIDKLNPSISHYECLGNHDYGQNGLTSDRTSNIPWDISHGSGICYGDYNENYVQFVQIGGEEYGILVLEFAVRTEVLEWAKQVLKQYPNNKFIVLTHAFLNPYGHMYSELTIAKDYDNPQSYAISYSEDTRNSVQIFNALCDASLNLKYIICGHSLPEEGFKVNTQTNINGDPVKIMMINFQHYANGGNGNIAILKVGSLHDSLIIYSTRTRECIERLNL